ncbi:DUF1168-domain-containing protein [Pisolithus microcarpus]|nr:DUF1168-domain-containing protein [Pisolithus microcarpus]
MSASKSPAPNSHSASPAPGQTVRHAVTPLDHQRIRSKPAYIPPPPKEKTIPAGAGSGEFHVYKASRRREYERLKMMEESARKVRPEDAQFERKRKEAEEQAAAKTAKNRARRQKKKERMKAKPVEKDTDGDDHSAKGNTAGAPVKKRRMVNGTELVFRKPGEESDEDEDEELADGQGQPVETVSTSPETALDTGLISSEQSKIVIHEDD